MFVEVRRETSETLPPGYGPEILVYAKRSEPLLTYWFNQELIAIVGFVPCGLWRLEAYLWMQETPATARHPTAVARLGRLTLREMIQRYPTIVGECLVGSNSIKWLKWLGAEFLEPQGLSHPFIIRTMR